MSPQWRLLFTELLKEWKYQSKGQWTPAVGVYKKLCHFLFLPLLWWEVKTKLLCHSKEAALMLILSKYPSKPPQRPVIPSHWLLPAGWFARGLPLRCTPFQAHTHSLALISNCFFLFLYARSKTEWGGEWKGESKGLCERREQMASPSSPLCTRAPVLANSTQCLSTELFVGYEGGASTQLPAGKESVEKRPEKTWPLGGSQGRKGMSHGMDVQDQSPLPPPPGPEGSGCINIQLACAVRCCQFSRQQSLCPQGCRRSWGERGIYCSLLCCQSQITDFPLEEILRWVGRGTHKGGATSSTSTAKINHSDWES